MNILIITKKLPYPTEDGASIRCYHTIKHLSTKFDITLLSISREEVSSHAIEELNKFCKKIEITNLKANLFLKLYNLIKSYLTQVPYTVLANTSNKLKKNLRELLKENSFDYLQVEELYLIKNLDKKLYSKTTLSTYNIESKILERLSNNKNLIKKFYYDTQSMMMKKFECEISSILKTTTTVSKLDYEYYKKFSKNTLLIPNSVESVHATNEDRRDELLLTGILSYEPNREGIYYFLNEIAPLIENVKIKIVARNPPKSLLKFQSDNIKFLANEDSMVKHFSKSFALCVPLFSGGGTRLKILEAFSYGLPVISTSIGAEGIEVTNEQNILIANTKEDFIQSIKKLRTNTNLYKTLSNNGKDLVSNKYLWKDAFLPLINYYSKNE